MQQFERDYASATFNGDLNQQIWDRILQSLDLRLDSVETLRTKMQEAIDNLVDVGVTKISDVLLPAFEKARLLSSLGFLIATSNSPQTLAVNADITFVVPEGPARDLFTPSPFVTIARRTDPNTYALVRTVSYLPTFGEYRCIVISATGPSGPFSDWSLACGTGVIPAVQQLLDLAITARNQAAASATAADTSAKAIATVTAGDRAATKADRDATAADRVQTGKDREAAAASAQLAATFDPTTYQRTTFNIQRFAFAESTLSAGQTVFAIPPGYTAGSASVFVNGSRLAGTEFTATNGTSVTLSAPVDGGDVVEVVTFLVNGVLNVAPLGHTHTLADFNLTAALARKTWNLTASQAVFTMPDPFVQIDFWVNGSMMVEGTHYTVSGQSATFAPALPSGSLVQARAVAIPLAIPTAYTRSEMDALRADATANHEFYGRYFGGV